MHTYLDAHPCMQLQSMHAHAILINIHDHDSILCIHMRTLG